MARGQAKSNVKNNRRQPSIPKNQGEVFRKSPPLQAIENLRKQSSVKSDHIQEARAPLPPTILEDSKVCVLTGSLTMS